MHVIKPKGLEIQMLFRVIFLYHQIKFIPANKKISNIWTSKPFGLMTCMNKNTNSVLINTHTYAFLTSFRWFCG